MAIIKEVWPMDVNLAVKSAIESINSLFGNQGIYNVLLEEVERDENGGYMVTIGFDRNVPTASVGALSGIAGLLGRGRVFKVVKFDAMGEVVSVKDRLIK